MPSSEELQNDFYVKYACKLDDLLHSIRKDCEDKGIPILNDPKSSINSDFVDMIMYSIKSSSI